MAAQQLALDYAAPTFDKDLFTMPYPSKEIAFPNLGPLTHAKNTGTHYCGLCKTHRFCMDARRCHLPVKLPCPRCEIAVRESYRAGRYAVTR